MLLEDPLEMTASCHFVGTSSLRFFASRLSRQSESVIKISLAVEPEEANFAKRKFNLLPKNFLIQRDRERKIKIIIFEERKQKWPKGLSSPINTN